MEIIETSFVIFCRSDAKDKFDDGPEDAVWFLYFLFFRHNDISWKDWKRLDWTKDTLGLA